MQQKLHVAKNILTKNTDLKWEIIDKKKVFFNHIHYHTVKTSAQNNEQSKNR